MVVSVSGDAFWHVGHLSRHTNSKGTVGAQLGHVSVLVGAQVGPKAQYGKVQYGHCFSFNFIERQRNDLIKTIRLM